MTRPVALLVILALMTIGLTGCGRSTSGSASSRTWGSEDTGGVPGIDSGSLTTAKETVNGNEIQFAVWSDFTDGSGIRAGANSDSGWVVEGTIGCRSDRTLPAPFKCTSPDGVTATMTIAGVDYNVSEGPLFLVSTQGKRPEVLQLKFDIQSLPKDNESSKQFAKSNKQIVDFFHKEKGASEKSSGSEKSPSSSQE